MREEHRARREQPRRAGACVQRSGSGTLERALIVRWRVRSERARTLERPVQEELLVCADGRSARRPKSGRGEHTTSREDVRVFVHE
jgi:hypothetical protein